MTNSPVDISGSLIGCASATGYPMQSGVIEGTASATSTIDTPARR
ncbi:hypothetical protein [Actinokineospora sp. UTMC 2448]|nr:hypothetical protein [Actinokineospora sp. UTMC 2448]UVS78465.1 hypothetical protein Actkin_02198 [Actinokineospora sp. UTMC 2448]